MAKLTAKYTMDGHNISLYFPDNTINTEIIADNAITENKIASGAIAPGMFLDGSITREKLVKEIITHEYIAPLTIMPAQLQDAAVTAAKLAEASVSTDHLVDLMITAGKLAANSVDWQSVVFGTGKPADHANYSAQDTFTEVFDYESTSDLLNNWTRESGSSDVTLLESSSAITGGKLMQLGNNTGNDECWMVYNKSISFDPDKLYRVKVRLRSLTSLGVIYIGWAGRNYTDTAWVNKDGADALGSQHHHVLHAFAQSYSTTFTEYVGYTKGHAAMGDNAQKATSTAPGAIQDDAKYVRPMIIANYSAVAGTVEIDSFIVETVSLYDNGDVIESYKPAAFGADVTGDNTAANITGQGALALLNSADWSSQVAGTGKPGDYANYSAQDTFIETFDNSPSDDKWEQVGTEGEHTIVENIDSVHGGNMYRLGNNSGNDEVYCVHKNNIPFDATKLYRFKVIARKAVGSTTGKLSIAVVGTDYTGNVWVNRLGANNSSSPNYMISTYALTTTFTEHVGFLRGTDPVEGSLTASPSSTDPGKVHEDTRYLRPVIYANVSDATGQVEIASYVIEAVTVYDNGDVVEEYKPAEAGADVTGSNTAANITGQGALALLNSADWSSQVLGTGKPANYADVTGDNTAAYVSDTGVTSFLSKTAMGEVMYQAIGNAHMANAAIESAQIASLAVGAGAIALLAVGTAQIANAAITNAKVNDLAANKITAGELDANRIGAGTISAVKLATNSVTSDKILANTIAACDIAAYTITAGEIASNAITSVKINANAVIAGKIAAGAINATNIVATDSIITSHILADNVSVTGSGASYTQANLHQGASYGTITSFTLYRAISKPVMLSAMLAVMSNDASGNVAQIALYRDTTLLIQTSVFDLLQDVWNHVPLLFSVSAATGSHTYYLKARRVFTRHGVYENAVITGMTTYR